MDFVGNRTLRDLWDDLAADYGDKRFLAYVDDDEELASYTYGEFNRLIDQTANFLWGCGIRPGDRVAMHLNNIPEAMLVLFGAAKIGAISVPVNSDYLDDEVGYVIGKSGASAVVLEREFLPLYASSDGDLRWGVSTVLLVGSDVEEPNIESFWDGVRRQPEALAVRPALSSESDAEIIFTSGTTSHPKGVVFTHCNMLYAGHYGNWQQDIWEGDILHTVMPACHANFQMGALMPVLTAGAQMVMVRHYSASRFWRQVRDYGATVVQCVSMMVRTLLKQSESELDACNDVKNVLYYLAITDAEKIEFERRFDVRILNMYGATETICSILSDPPQGRRKWPSVGRPGLSYEVAIVDEEGRELPPGEPGEIIVKGVPGRTLLRCYWDDPDATAKALDERNWFHTGDKGYYDEAGWFYFQDRKSNMIKRSGENISASEVEEVICEIEGVSEAAVIGVPDPIRDQAVKAFVRLDVGATLAAEEVVRHCEERLASFKVPQLVEFVEDFPRSQVGKIAKRELR